MALTSIQNTGGLIKLYHGTRVRSLNWFDISCSRSKYLDFGVGMYFTTNLQQAKDWSVRYSNMGAVYEVYIDISNIKLKEFLTYSNTFIDTFCLCRAGLEDEAKYIQGYEAVYGYMIDNDKDTITRVTQDYAIGKTSPSLVRNNIKVFDDKDQLCIKSQQLLNRIVIKREYDTERVLNKKGRMVGVKWVK